MRRAPGLAIPLGGLLAHGLCRQSPARHHWSDRAAVGSPWTTVFKSAWVLNTGGVTTEGKGEHSPPLLKHPHPS